MRNDHPPLPRRRRAWWLLELGAGLTVAASLLLAHTGARLARAHALRTRARRRLAYFMARGLAAELRHSSQPGDYRDRPLASLQGIRRDLGRLPVPARVRRDLVALRLTVLETAEEVVVHIQGPGVREERRAPWAR
jgi:hypothetical protein